MPAPEWLNELLWKEGAGEATLPFLRTESAKMIYPLVSIERSADPILLSEAGRCQVAGSAAAIAGYYGDEELAEHFQTTAGLAGSLIVVPIGSDPLKRLLATLRSGGYRSTRKANSLERDLLNLGMLNVHPRRSRRLSPHDRPGEW